MDVETAPGSDDRLEVRGMRGTNQSGMRAYNERLVLSLLRQHGALAKTDIARLTGLSAQTTSVIMRELEAEGLLIRGEPLRGKVGQPSVPMSLAPGGAAFLGLKVGRRTSDLVLIDFLGTVSAIQHDSYAYPEPARAVDFALSAMEKIRAGLPARETARIAGLGIAMPFELWNWADAAGAPASVLEAWREADLRQDIAARLPFPVFLQNDATAACGAELVFGGTRDLRDFVYIFIGTFAGGGVVLNGSLYPGQTGNAGALGSMPVPGAHGEPRQLIDYASLAVLERALGPSAAARLASEDWSGLGPALDGWLDDAARALACAALASAAVIDFQAMVVDGSMPTAIRRRLVETVRREVAKLDAEGVAVPEIREGTIGPTARALGAASLPLAERFLVGQRLVGMPG